MAGNEDSRAYLLFVPRGARVVATDAHGRPALLVHETGRGRSVPATYPLGHMAARTARVNPERTRRLYAALAELATLRDLATGEEVAEVGLAPLRRTCPGTHRRIVHGYQSPERCPRRLPSKRKRALGAGRSGSVPEHEQPDQH